MNKPMHTPGPWSIDRDGDVVSKGWNIAYIALNESPGEQAANARLISAAPDLLEVAQGALTVLRRLAHDGKQNMVCIQARDGAMVNVLGLTNDLRAAIAKATGEGA